MNNILCFIAQRANDLRTELQNLASQIYLVCTLKYPVFTSLKEMTCFYAFMIHFSSSRFVWTSVSYHINNEAMENKRKKEQSNKTQSEN